MLVIVWVCVIGAQSPRRLESISIMGLLYIPYCRLRLLLPRDSTAYHYQGTGPPRAQGGCSLQTDLVSASLWTHSAREYQASSEHHLG